MQFIYTMKGLGKVHPPDHVVLKDIWLSFLPGAKIGVLGLNGSGKSSLLRIMAGEDQQFVGEAWPAEGISVGFLPQEPRLDPSKTVLGNVEEGVAELKALLTRYDEINAKFGEDLSPEEMDKSSKSRARSRIASKPRTGGISIRAWNWRWTRSGLPPPDADVAKLSGGERRRVALCRLLLKSPDLLLLDEPTNHLDAESVAWLERFLKDYPGTVVAVTHDRYFLDNVAAGSWSSIAARAFHGRATTRRGWSRSSSASRWRRRRKPSVNGRCLASSNGYACHPAPARRRAKHG